MKSEDMKEKCFAYNDSSCECDILTELLCETKGKCSFYKPEKQFKKEQDKTLNERLQTAKREYYLKHREEILIRIKRSRERKNKLYENPTTRSMKYYEMKRKLAEEDPEKFEYEQKETEALNKELEKWRKYD